MEENKRMEEMEEEKEEEIKMRMRMGRGSRWKRRKRRKRRRRRSKKRRGWSPSLHLELGLAGGQDQQGEAVSWRVEILFCCLSVCFSQPSRHYFDICDIFFQDKRGQNKYNLIASRGDL